MEEKEKAAWQRRRPPREKETEIRARAEIAGEHASDSVLNVSKGEHRIVGGQINEVPGLSCLLGFFCCRNLSSWGLS